MTRILLLAFIVLFGCTQPTEPRHAGGSTDTGNTIIGSVLDPGGSPGASAMADLSLRRSDYLSPLPSLGKGGLGKGGPGGIALSKAAAGYRMNIDLADTSTDERGAFRLDSVDPGSYRLEARQGNGLSCLFDALAVNDTLALKVDGARLKATAKVGGTVLLRPDALRAFVQVYGMERLMPVNTATGRFEVLLPEGRFRVRLVDPDAGENGIRVKEVDLKAGDSLDIGNVDLRDSAAPYPEWAYSRRLWINTTASGAELDRDVYGFPMLVRLDASMIDFAQAGPKGADLRFTKAGGKIPLAYEIERWDAAAQSAVVWVRMDTVRADASDRYIHMHWGNAAAVDSSNGPAVFDTALGFSGVWHLDEGSNEAGFPGYLDATANRNTGKGVAISDTTVGPGAVGRGQRLDGLGAYIHVPDAPALKLGTGDFCISVWARPDALFRNHQLLSKRENTAGDLEFQVRADGKVDSYVGDSGAVDPFPSRSVMTQGEWRLMTLRRAGTVTGLYLDGILDTAVTAASAFDVDNAADFFIGHDAQNLMEDWQGALDEVRMFHRAMPVEWLRLSYLSQKADAKLVTPFRP
jgi:hypothetical protein